MKQRISKTTIATRIRRGWTKEEAENTPLIRENILTLESVLEMEAHGLSQSKIAELEAFRDATRACLDGYSFEQIEKHACKILKGGI